ncbi:porin family protein [Pedobacter sp. SYP-B3415]|uniref:porin family protein n=1 Tax=Pedobacter sp. SYP-B3415 TaxID=2496641 RepID=UPI00101C6E5A|nr:porin family protein [Pedobacter sp. SYP-B3415]
MKKLLLSFLFLGLYTAASAQIVPAFQLGVKAGVNLAKFNTENRFGSDNRTGFYGGLWGRVGAAGIHFQPELYISGKNTELTSDATGEVNEVNFTSLDVPLLIGTKIGAAGIGARLNTGPMVSFILSKDQKFGQAAANIYNGNFKNQAFGWQFGAGVDVRRISLDLRYELGLSKLSKDGYPDTKLNLFTLGLALRVL